MPTLLAIADGHPCSAAIDVAGLLSKVGDREVVLVHVGGERAPLDQLAWLWEIAEPLRALGIGCRLRSAHGNGLARLEQEIQRWLPDGVVLPLDDIADILGATELATTLARQRGTLTLGVSCPHGDPCVPRSAPGLVEFERGGGAGGLPVEVEEVAQRLALAMGTSARPRSGSADPGEGSGHAEEIAFTVTSARGIPLQRVGVPLVGHPVVVLLDR